MKNRLVMTGTLGTMRPEQIKGYETEFLRQFPEGEFEFLSDTPLADEELIEKINGADVLLNTAYQQLSEKVYATAAPTLRACLSLGIGYDSCNITAATKHNVVLANQPDWCQQEVAVHTIMLLLALHRGLLPTIRALDNGRWTDRFSIIAPVFRFSNETVGFFGFGNIARETAKMLRGFGVRMIAHDPYADKAVFATFGVTSVDFETLAREADYLSVHAPLLPGTEKCINAKVFAMMKKSASLINTSRGGLVNPDDLYAALTAGKIRAAALDVFMTEPPTGIEAELCKLPNVLSSPHIAYYSETAAVELRDKAIADAVRVLKGVLPLSVKNPEVQRNLTWVKNI